MWLTGRLVPDHKTIANFRKDNGKAIRKVCAQFVGLCRQLKLFADASVAIDGSKFKAVNTRDKNFTRGKVKRRMDQIEECVDRYLHQLDSSDRQEPSRARTMTTERLSSKIETLKDEMQRLKLISWRLLPTEATSRAKKSWPAIKPTLRSRFLNRRPQTTKLGVVLLSRIFDT